MFSFEGRRLILFRSLDILYEGLGISKLKFFIKKFHLKCWIRIRNTASTSSEPGKKCNEFSILTPWRHILDPNGIRNIYLQIVFWWTRYLLAMVFVYFKRAELQHTEYTQHNFWVCLHLAHDAEAKCHCHPKNCNHI